jgi:hypothetical protein
MYSISKAQFLHPLYGEVLLHDFLAFKYIFHLVFNKNQFVKKKCIVFQDIKDISLPILPLHGKSWGKVVSLFLNPFCLDLGDRLSLGFVKMDQKSYASRISFLDK